MKQSMQNNAPLIEHQGRGKHLHKRKLALLLPGHNEEFIIATTIQSAVSAGQDIRDIFVVNDASSDKTRAIATALLGKSNVLNVQRSGKALAVKKAIKRFKIQERYYWVHIADADSMFGKDYFRIYRRSLKQEYVVAVGFVQSLRGNWISTYRSITYTYSQHVTRRLQSYVGMISVLPGPITSFRTDILNKLDFTGSSLTEDFDVTLQIHRQKLGKIVFIPSAISYTQDPQSLKDFCRQNQRWQRGFFQGIKKYGIGKGSQKIDISLGLQMGQTILFMIQLLILLPIIIVTTHSARIIPIAISADIIITSFIAITSALAIKRWRLIGALPYFYLLRGIEIIIYLQAALEVLILKRFRSELRGWATEGRRYKVSSEALQDVAVTKTA